MTPAEQSSTGREVCVRACVCVSVSLHRCCCCLAAADPCRICCVLSPPLRRPPRCCQGGAGSGQAGGWRAGQGDRADTGGPAAAKVCMGVCMCQQPRGSCRCHRGPCLVQPPLLEGTQYRAAALRLSHLQLRLTVVHYFGQQASLVPPAPVSSRRTRTQAKWSSAFSVHKCLSRTHRTLSTHTHTLTHSPTTTQASRRCCAAAAGQVGRGREGA